ncbi:glycosyltransferase family 2 protein [Planctobacterium marinum]|uniref:Glycosyltransferase 2-like domain-containing protein n=1 Tax=Planctobacterium marinum TaxID=1631968 RepID=A0AA48HKT7_9ALTE|nr:hypothetical protein MACH26_37770 [Planctobacterium marinum]
MNNQNFSVVIPLYNKANHILDAIASIKAQSVPADEIIIIDDGSSDNGVAIVEQANIADVRIIRQANQGVSVARNNGIKAARNQYVAFLDADDTWLPFFLEEMQLLIAKFPQCKFFASRYQCIDGDKYVDAKINLEGLDPQGVLLSNYFEVAASGDLPFMISSAVIEKSLVDSIGGFPPGERIGEDQDFFARAAMYGPIAYSPNIHLMYRRDAENSATSTWVPEQECPFSERLKHQVARLNQKVVAQQVNKYSAAHLCHLAKLNIYKGRFRSARKLLADTRCNLKAKHKWGLLTLSYLKQAQYSLSKSNAL